MIIDWVLRATIVLLLSQTQSTSLANDIHMDSKLVIPI